MPRPAGMVPGSAAAAAWALAEADKVSEQNHPSAAGAGAVAAAGWGTQVTPGPRALNAKSHPRFVYRDLADELGVVLDAVEGTGPGSCITATDIRAAAARQRSEAYGEVGLDPDTLQVALAASYAVLAGDGTASGVAGASGPMDTSAMALNPLPARARAEQPEVTRMAVAKAPAPTLFSSGHLPAFTASGIPPSQLLGVPFSARHALAAAATTAHAYAIVDSLSGLAPDAAESKAADLGYSEHPGVGRYERAVQAWLDNGPTPEQKRALMNPPAEDSTALDSWMQKTGWAQKPQTSA